MQKMTLDEMKSVEFDMLSFFVRFCEEYDLKYYLIAGTLLGAIRHNGYIPWDDDIDVAMPYPDYERFIELFNKKNSDNIDIWYDMKHRVGLPFVKMVDLRTATFNKGRDKNNSFPVWIDIFPMFALSDDDNEAVKQLDDLVELTWESWKHMKTYSGKNILKRFFSYVKHYIKLTDCIRKAKTIAKRYEYGTTARIASVYRGIKRNKDRMNYLMTDSFDNYTYHQFESGSFRIPKDYDGYLTRMYGDYMQLPPEEERLPHPFEAYWRD